MPTARLAARDVCRLRLARQFLTTSGPAQAADVVRALGAVQSQDYPGATWALSQRTAGRLDAAAIEREFAAGAILRTHVLRPTWHFVAPEDIRWLLALTGPRVAAQNASYARSIGLDAGVYRRTRAAIERALRDGRHLTRQELRDAMERAKAATFGRDQRLAYVMMQAELDGVVCSGPRVGKQFTYALLEERVPPAAPLDRDEALRRLTTRYFTTRGPATLQDFGWWSGLTIADAKRGVAMAGPLLSVVRLADRPAWMAADAGPAPAARGRAHLLPNYDEYFIGFKDRSAIADRIGTTELVTGGDALSAHVAFLDGQLVGGWRRDVGAREAVVTFTFVVRLAAAERRRLDAVAGEFGRFAGLPVRVQAA